MAQAAALARGELITVAEAGARLGVSPRTLRYYEELGFLTPVRTAGKHRLYGPAEIETVERIGRMQALGFSLTTIRKALRYRYLQDESGTRRLALADLRQIAAEARADAHTVRERIAALRRELESATREAERLEHDAAYLEQAVLQRSSAGQPAPELSGAVNAEDAR